MNTIELIRTEEVFLETEIGSFLLVFEFIAYLKIKPSLQEAHLTGEVTQKIYVETDYDYL